jgi:hypothetical protein
MRLRKTKRYSRKVIAFKEVQSYVATRCAAFGLKKSDLPCNRTMRALINEVPRQSRKRSARKIRTVFNSGITAEQLGHVSYFSSRN